MKLFDDFNAMWFPGESCCLLLSTAPILYRAAENRNPYQGIESYESACGKMIKKVLADNPNTLYDNSCDSNLYFVFDGGVLTLT